jgi:hypothetical protein
MLYVPLLSAPFYFHDLFKYAPHSSGSHAGGRLRHAFIGLGFRERTEAYDFQAALHDHMKYIPIYYMLFLPFYPMPFIFKP